MRSLQIPTSNPKPLTTLPAGTDFKPGRHSFGLAAIVFGVATIAWRDASVWQQVAALAPHRALLAILSCATAAIEILGGLAIQWPKTARTGAIALAGVFSIFTLLCVPGIVAAPGVYNSWGNFFEQLSQAMGPLLLFAALGLSDSARGSVPKLHMVRTARIAYFLFGLCVISFGTEQYVYLRPTVSLVPKWIPPGQMFWAVATTIAFWVAGLALLIDKVAPFTERLALLAARLLTAMMFGFLVLVWVPILVAHPHAFFNWSETAETLAIAACGWIVAEYLSQQRRVSQAEVPARASAD